MAPKKVTFENTAGDKLAALLEQPPGNHPVAYAIIAHCFTCNKDFKAPVNISRALVNEGIGVLRFDFIGLGDSEGDFSDTNFTSNVADLVAAARFVESSYGPVRILVGHSLGGTAALWAAPSIPSSVAVATINSPYEPAHLTHVLDPVRETILSEGQARVEVGGTAHTIKKQFLDDVEGADAKTAIASLNRALLIFHAPGDDTVSIENASRIFFAAKHPKSFVSIKARVVEREYKNTMDLARRASKRFNEQAEKVQEQLHRRHSKTGSGKGSFRGKSGSGLKA